MARFGQLYLDEGEFQGNPIVPAEWVRDSLQTYSEDAWDYRVGKNWQDSGYGYQWWSIRAGAHRYNLAWSHGGQQIALLDELDMVVVATADHCTPRAAMGPGSSRRRISTWWPISSPRCRLSENPAGCPRAEIVGECLATLRSTSG